MKRDKRCAGREMFFCFIAVGFLYVLICQSDSKKKRKGAVLSLLLPVIVSSVLLVSRAPQFSVDPYQSSRRVERSLLMHWDSRIINLEDKMYLAGYIIGVYSAGLYVCSRVPQIVKNVRNFSHSLSLSPSLSPSSFSLFFYSYMYMHTHSSCVAQWNVFLYTQFVQTQKREYREGHCLPE